MQTDKNGCSICENGRESYEEFYSDILKKNLIQYDYRTPEGKLFSCCTNNLENARKRRDLWLNSQFQRTSDFEAFKKEAKNCDCKDNQLCVKCADIPLI